MKHMQDFQKWLSAANTTPSPNQRRLSALTRLDRAQLSKVSGELAWFMWEAPQSANVA